MGEDRPWTAEEDAQVVHLIGQCVSLRKMPLPGRSPSAIAGRVRRNDLRRRARRESRPAEGPPSRSALRLAEFDPIVRRALAERVAT